jgi:ABC-2 type transport system permease protein/sodium transport system permease protein
LTRKELRETLRDRRTIITLVLMPLLVYPLLSVAFRQFFFSTYSKATDIEWRIGGNNEKTLSSFGQQLRDGGQLIDAIDGAENGPAQGILVHEFDGGGGGEKRGYRPGRAVAIRPLSRSPRGRPAPIRADLPAGFRAQSLHRGLRGAAIMGIRSDQIFRAFATTVQRQWLAPLRSGGARPLLANPGKSFPWATLVPLILILMTITGAVYPAIDLTAGERERGNSRVPHGGAASAPEHAPRQVLCRAHRRFADSRANLAAMSITVYSTGLGSMLFGEQGLRPSAILIVLSLLVLFAAFFSALLLAVTSFARSFKEAQAYLIPFMLLAIAPGFLSVMPGIELGHLWAVTPLVNIVLLARDVLQGTFRPLLAGEAVVSTALYGVASLALAARIFGSDAILYGSQGSWSDLFRRPDELRTQPTLAGAALCTAVVFALQIVTSGCSASGLPRCLSARSCCCRRDWGAFCIWHYQRRSLGRSTSACRAGFSCSTGRCWPTSARLSWGCRFWTFAHELILFTQQFSFLNVDLQKLGAAKFAEKIKEIDPFPARGNFGHRSRRLRRVVLPRLFARRAPGSPPRLGRDCRNGSFVRAFSRLRQRGRGKRPPAPQHPAWSRPRLGLLADEERLSRNVAARHT